MRVNLSRDGLFDIEIPYQKIEVQNKIIETEKIKRT